MAAANTEIHDASSKLDVSVESSIQSVINVLDGQAKLLAADEELRADVGSAQPDVWSPLRRMWTLLSMAHSAMVSEDDDDAHEAVLRNFTVSLARFTRNLVAAVTANQERAFENEPDVRALLRHYTSYTVLQNPKSLDATRMLIQALCNLVTGNEILLSRLWELYLELPEEQLILLRLFGVEDTATTTAAFVLVLNCLHDSKHRTSLLTDSTNGPRLCISLLDRIASVFEAEQETNSSPAFEIGYRIFTKIVETNAIPAAYSRIAVEGEVVSPHQTTLLKLLDSYLQPSQPRELAPDSNELRVLCAFLTREFFVLSAYTCRAISRALGPADASATQPHDARDDDALRDATAGAPPDAPAPASPGPLQELDLLLPKVCEALVLVTQCLTSLALASEEHYAQAAPLARAPQPHGERLADAVASATSPAGAQGFVECLVETLRELDRFLPRITLGKVAPGAVPVDRLPEGVRGLREAQTAHGGGAAGTRTDNPKGFQFLKRDLVRLLGILVSDRRATQDRVRACGGVQVVMNMCVIDERNPFLREHAIFTLRNLLHGNKENQALVEEIKPVGEWDDNGMLQGRGHAVQR
ncbi:spinocerebellar ataxia type 10 protein domain-containing protein [Phanerochaete sordida]|uniref:Ataxin-10 homolog n=1 Tax=Phanerochaete sordida TaxID=48140 RepID=A0A9P3GAQ1_9APHY|nr:spinocerebellar ataxia type 10 protein domain-containing protein [Phanerochaete sordida]